jgi:uridine kinase
MPAEATMTTHLLPLFLIAGGSGSGKTTLAETLVERHPGWTLIHLDDYQKTKEEVPKVGGRRNWDEPDAVDFTSLIHDLEALRRGQTVDVLGWSRTGRDAPRERLTIVPGSALILEGYLALWHPDVRKMAEYSIFLHASATVRHARRRWTKDDGYLQDVLEPMHRLHVEPTQAFADVTFDASACDALEMVALAELCLGV